MGPVGELTVFFRPLAAMRLVAKVIGDHMAQRFGPPPEGLRRVRWDGSLAQFVAHSLSFTTVHRRSRAACSGWSRTLADGGERWCAVLESV
jgi:hypothetical protein